jgi:hypothetical protein
MGTGGTSDVDAGVDIGSASDIGAVAETAPPSPSTQLDGKWMGMNNLGAPVSFSVCKGEVLQFKMRATVSYANSSCSDDTNQGKSAPITDNTAKFTVGIPNASWGFDVTITFNGDSMATGSIPATENGGLVCKAPAILAFGTKATVTRMYTFQAQKVAPDGC